MKKAPPATLDPRLFLIIGGVAILLVIVGLIVLAVQVRQMRQSRQETEGELDDMRKEFKLRGDEISKKLAAITTEYSGSGASLADAQSKLAAFESQLKSVVSSITTVENKIPDLADVGRRLQDLRANLDSCAKEIAAAAKSTQDLESAHDDAIRRVRELELATRALQEVKGTAPVAPTRESIESATVRAIELAWQQGATSEAQLAKKMATEEGDRILRAFDAASRQDVEGAAAIIDASAYDPFTLHPNLWEGAVASKRTLELARNAALVGMELKGFKVDQPKVGIDAFDKDAHDLRDSVPTEKEELKGKIAEVRRPGLRFNGRVIRPARVVQYAIDYKKAALTPEEIERPSIESPVQETPLSEMPTTVPPPAEVPERKRGVAEF